MAAKGSVRRVWTRSTSTDRGGLLPATVVGLDPIPASSDPALDRLHVDRRRGAHLVCQERPVGLIAAQCVSLSTSTRQGPNQQTARAISKGMQRHEHTEGRDGLGATLNGDQVGCTFLHRRSVHLRQSDCVSECPRSGLELAERWPGPHRQSLLQSGSSIVGEKGIVDAQTERLCVNIHVEQVADRRRDKRLFANNPTKTGHRVAQCPRRDPERVGQFLGTHRSPHIQCEHSEQPALADARDVDHRSGRGDELYRTQHPDESDPAFRCGHDAKYHMAALGGDAVPRDRPVRQRPFSPT